MTLGMSLVVLGLTNVYQLLMVTTPTGVPADDSAGSAPADLAQFLPNSLLVFVPSRRSSCSACGGPASAACCTPSATTRSPRAWPGARVWQVLIVLYMLSALLAAVAGFLISGLANTASVIARRAYRPAVGRRGGHRRDVDHGRPRRLLGDDHRGADPDRPHARSSRRSGIPEAVRQVLFGAIIVAVAAAYTRVTGET